MRHDLYARMRELSSKFEGVETVDVGTLPRRVRRENPDITSPLLTKKCARQILSHFHRYLELRVPRRPRSFAKRVQKVGDLKGKVPYSIVRLRVLVKTHKPALSRGRLSAPSHRQPTWASKLFTHDGNYCAPKFPSPSTRLPFHFPLGARLVSRWPCLLSHRSGGRGCLCM